MVLCLCMLTPLLFGQKDSVTTQLNEKNDWPALRRYREANALLKPDKDRVVFMGNSITEFWSVRSPAFFEGKPYVNRGISGQTTPQMLLRFRQDVIAIHPKIVVILAGINDIAGNTGPASVEMITDNIASMAELAYVHGIRVILCSILPACSFPWRPDVNPVDKIIAVNKWIKAFAEQHHFEYVDYYTAMADERKGLPLKYAEDGVHPTAEGYKVMEGLVEKAIAKINRLKK